MAPVFERKTLVVSQPSLRIRYQHQHKIEQQELASRKTVLVVGLEERLATPLIQNLKNQKDFGQILFAPTLGVAEWLLLKREVSIVISTAILADGQLKDLKKLLYRMAEIPSLIVIGSSEDVSQELSVIKKRATPPYVHRKPHQLDTPAVTQTIKVLGADLRNDLNNPLQEIVTMVYVAKMGSPDASAANEALGAIERAANQMATVVKSFEGKMESSILG